MFQVILYAHLYARPPYAMNVSGIALCYSRERELEAGTHETVAGHSQKKEPPFIFFKTSAFSSKSLAILSDDFSVHSHYAGGSIPEFAASL